MAETYQEIAAIFENKCNELKLEYFNSFDQLENGIALCHKTLQHLKRKVLLEGFRNITEEIHFFKALKPKQESYLYFLYKVRTHQLVSPQIHIQKELQFLNKEIRKINKFYAKHRELIYYMDRGPTDLDNHYFTRRGNSAHLKIKKHRYRDMDFSTPYDLLWARIKAMQLYKRYIGAEYQRMETQSNQISAPITNGRQLKWTASKIALIELVYAIYSNGAINHGKEDIKSIATIFEKVLNTKLGNFYKTYTEMKARKGNRARFLQELATDLQEKMEEDDAF